jgi:hypothetical protein
MKQLYLFGVYLSFVGSQSRISRTVCLNHADMYSATGSGFKAERTTAGATVQTATTAKYRL